MKIGIVVGSIREGRVGRGVAEWVKQQADRQAGAEFEIVDLADFDVPLLTAATLPAMANGEYDDPAVTAWGRAIAGYDGFIFVTAEYNHSVPGAFKNAVDSLGVEWMGKAVGFVSYGADNGVRAVEHWRNIIANFQMVGVRQQVSLNRFSEWGENGFAPSERRARDLSTLFDQLTTAVAGQLTTAAGNARA